jgi:hypothetical protein
LKWGVAKDPHIAKTKLFKVIEYWGLEASVEDRRIGLHRININVETSQFVNVEGVPSFK